MPGLPRRGAAASPQLAVLVLWLCAGGGAAVRVGRDGTRVCERVGFLVESGVQNPPPEVTSFVVARNCMSEYKALVEDLSMAPKGRVDSWKSSALNRVMYIGGHEEAFRSRGVSIFLTKKAPEGALSPFKTSKIQVCFVDGADAEPPTLVYRDTEEAITIERGGLSYTRSLPEGALGQAYTESQPLQADKATMPVDLLRVFESKGAMLDYINMAALINIRVWSWGMALEVARTFMAKFRERGLGLFYCVRTEYDHKGRAVRLPWFEYADLAVAGENYNPSRPPQHACYSHGPGTSP